MGAGINPAFTLRRRMVRCLIRAALISGQLTAQRLEEKLGLQTLTLNLGGDFAGDICINWLEWTASGLRQYLCSTGALQEEEVVIRIIQTFAADDDAMITQEDDIRALHGVGDAFAFADIERQPVVVFVDRQAAVKAHGILGQRRIQPAI